MQDTSSMILPESVSVVLSKLATCSHEFSINSCNKTFDADESNCGIAD